MKAATFKMKRLVVSWVLLLSLNLILGRICWRNVSVPCVEWGRRYVDRTTMCYFKCWSKLYESKIECGYYLDTCELAFKMELQPDCCPGYEKDSQGECQPVCKGGCINGKCIGPYQCGCEEGFRLDWNRCLPVCDSQCILGVCTSPGQCTCLPGHMNRTETECVPVCDPPCENGKCIAPNTCDCSHGFTKSPNSNHLCVPVCDSDIADCGNGTCVEPNRCLCGEGFVFRGHRCVPLCSSTCINGDCTNPNICTCKEGFQKSQVEPNVCVPVCEISCQNATCVAPNICQCLIGYQQSSTHNLCEPSCDQKFFGESNGQCFAPNVLRCNEGFLLTHSTESNRIACKSRCSPECVNAQCLQDGSCKCWSGFTSTEESPNICKPLCDPPCENSSCIGPNQCKCWDGYQPTLDDGTESSCSPFCEPSVVDCSNGSCIGANTCICNYGLELIVAEDNVTSCYPKCSEPCTNGFCPISPDICECLPGYNRTTTDEDCTPVCEDPCQNGICTAPGVCSCDSGFFLQNGTCERVLEQPRRSLMKQSSVLWLLVAVLSLCSGLYFIHLLVFNKLKISCEVHGNEEKDNVILRYFTEEIASLTVKDEIF